MKLYIPKIKDHLKLTSDWKFKLWCECRNVNFAYKFTGKNWSCGSNYIYCDKWYYEDTFLNIKEKKEFLNITLRIGTVISVDRIYIRKGSSGFDSVSFYEKTNKYGRFWAKLEDVNNIEFEPYDNI